MSFARINSRSIDIRPGDTILSAAVRSGIEIPTLCQAPGLAAEGNCRLCLVHSENHSLPLAACHTPLVEGMDLQTHHVMVEKWRVSLLKMQGEAGPLTGFHPNRVRQGRWRELTERYGILEKTGEGPEPARDYSHPMLRFDPGACLSCRLCLSACDTLSGLQVWEISGRGPDQRLTPVAGRDLADGSCTACGACIDHCPTGALAERHAQPPDEEPVRVTESVCGFCSVGCRIRTESGDEDVIRVTGAAGAEANPGGLLCQRGKFGHVSNEIWDRLTTPLIRLGAGFREATWDEAFDFIEKRLIATVAAHGPDSFGAIASTRATTESSYLLQKFCRAVIGSPHIDSSASLFHAPIFAALRQRLGVGAGTASFADIDDAACLVVAGADPDISHPVLAARIRQAVAAGAALMVFDPRRTTLADLADLHLQPFPGRDRLLLQALKGAIPKRPTLPVLDEEMIGVSAAALRMAAEMLNRYRGKTLFLTGIGLSRTGAATETVSELLDIAILTGNLGKAGAGFLPLGGQNNLQGCLDAGASPVLLPGQFDIHDAAARARIEDLWGRCLPESRGHTLPGMIAAAARGDLRALWMMGHDSNRALPCESLASLDLLVVQDLFYTDASRHAHVLLPAASSFEQSGIFISAERRAQLVRPSVPPPGLARPDWAVLTVLARRLGVAWTYLDPAQIFAELALLAPDRFGGITHQRLEKCPDGLQWPCPAARHPGTRTLRRKEVTAFADSETDVTATSTTDPAFPFLLITGRRLEHHNSGTETRRGLGRKLIDHDRSTLHPADALRVGVAPGDWVVIESLTGSAKVRVDISDRVQLGSAWITCHFPQTRLGGLFHAETRGTGPFQPLRVGFRPIG